MYDINSAVVGVRRSLALADTPRVGCGVGVENYGRDTTGGEVGSSFCLVADDVRGDAGGPRRASSTWASTGEESHVPPTNMDPGATPSDFAGEVKPDDSTLALVVAMHRIPAEGQKAMQAPAPFALEEGPGCSKPSAFVGQKQLPRYQFFLQPGIRKQWQAVFSSRAARTRWSRPPHLVFGLTWMFQDGWATEPRRVQL